MPRHESLPQFELFVLLSLVHCGGDAFGADIQREIGNRGGRAASLGAVYAALGRLESRGFVRHAATRPRPVKGGRARKLFTITSAGAEELQAAVDQLRRMLAEVPTDLAGAFR